MNSEKGKTMSGSEALRQTNQAQSSSGKQSEHSSLS